MLHRFIKPFARLSRCFAVSFVLLAAAGAAQAQLTISSIVDNPDPVPAGGTVTYTVGISELNGVPLTGGSFTLDVPADGIYAGTGTVPAGVSCAGMALNAPGPGTLTCTGINLAADEIALTQIRVRSTATGTLSVTAHVPSGGTQAQPTTVNQGADLEVAVVGTSTIAAGSTATYQLTVSNHGPNTSPSSTVSYALPPGFGLGAPPAGCSLAGSTLTCTVGALANGAQQVFPVTGVIGVGNGSTMTHAASVTPGGGVGDGVTDNNSATLNVSVTPGSAISVGKTKSVGGAVVTGSDFNFLLDPRYSGDFPTAPVLTDPMPANFCFTGPTTFSSGGWNCSTGGSICPAAGGTMSCTRAGGGTAGLNQALGIVTVPVRALTTGSVNNTATIAATGVTPVDNTLAITVIDPVSDLRANKTKSWPQAAVPLGQAFSYSLSTTNLGPTPFPASGTLTLTDNLPAGLQVTNIVPPAGFTCTPNGGFPVNGPATITCTSSNVALALNATTPAITVDAKATVTGTNLTNHMCVSGASGPIDTNAGNNCIDVGLTAQPPAQQADVSVLKRVIGLGDSAANRQVAGSPIVWDLEVVNTGPDVATNVLVTDVLNNVFNATAADYSVVVTPGNATAGACALAPSGTNVSLSGCTITSLPICTPGSTCPHITMTVRHFGSGTLASNDFTQANTAFALSQDVADPNLNNNDANNGTATNAFMTARTDVTVTKVGTPNPVPAGQKLTYVITARNLSATSASDAFNVVATDTLPSGLVFLSGAGSAGSTCSFPAVGSTSGPGNNTLSCTWPKIDRGASQTITVTVRPLVALSVAGGGSGSINNTVAIATDTPEIAGGAANNSAAEATAIITPAYDLLVNKTDDQDPVDVGDVVTYTLRATNNGASTAENVVLTDILPTDPGSPTFVEVVTPLPAGVVCTPVGVTVGQPGGTINCTIPVLGGTGPTATGEPTSVQVLIRLRGAAKGSYINKGRVSFANAAFNNATFDPQGNNAQDEPTLYRLKADVEVVGKRAVTSGSTTPVTAVGIGQVFDWLVDVRNNGPHAAETTTFTDNLPTNMVVAGSAVFTVTSGAFTPAAPVCAGALGASAVTCAIASMPPAGTAQVRIPVQIVAATATTFVNNASIVTTGSRDTNGGTDPNAGNNHGTGSVTLQTSPGLSGQVYVDSNKDGRLTAGEPPIAGVTVTLTGHNNSGTPVSVTTVTDAAGHYEFLGLAPSDAAGYTITETQPPSYADAQETVGLIDGTPVGAIGPDRITGIVYPGGVSATGTNYNFGETGGSLAGLVFNDVNKNGVQEQGDLPISGVTVTVTGVDAMGQAVNRTAVTGPDGRYRFVDLPMSDAAGYTVTETQPAAYDSVGEKAGTAGGTVTPNQIKVVLTTANPNITGYDFYEKTNQPAALTGVVWRDNNHDRARTPDEPVLAGWTAELMGCPNGAATCAQADLVVLNTKPTAADGSYRFDDLVPGSYQVRFRSPTGQVIGGVWPTDPVQNKAGGPNPTLPGADSRAFIPVTISAPGVTVINQDLPIDPSGVVYDSLSGQPVPGARVTLNGPPGFDPAVHLLGGGGSVITDTDGLYYFFLLPGAPPGDYSLAITPPGDYQLSPTFPPTAGPLNLQNCSSPAGRVDANGTDPCVVTPSPQPVVGTATTTYFLNFTLPAGGGQRLVNNHIPLDRAGSGMAIELRKTTSKLTAKKAELVPYTITARNTRGVAVQNVSLVDTLPPGFKYVEGSLKIQTLPSGAAQPAAISLVGRQFTVPGQNFVANETKKLTMVLGVGVGVGEGEYVNQVLARQGVGGPVISNVATAAIRVVPDALFDCTDVIGKVYDDKNANGYQDEGEPGLANIRIATVNGLLVTTDPQGRYHIDCALIPKDGTGSNLVLKLDERTLPSGYRITTENPADERATRGKIVKINFGATVHRVVRLDLQAGAFDGTSDQLRAELAPRRDELIRALAEKPSVMRLAYRAAVGEDAGLTKQRVAAVKEEVLKRWKAFGRASGTSEKALFNLDIEVELVAAPVKP
jgi:uncharacterized repeat protein (TIGR01451 family)